MNAEYTYILRLFLPEIILIGMGLLVLAADLVLGKRNTRRWLTLLAAMGCLAAALAAGAQWQAGDQPLPATVQHQVRAQANAASTGLRAYAVAHNTLAYELRATGRANPAYATAREVMRGLKDTVVAEKPATAWPFARLSQAQAEVLLAEPMQPISAHAAREIAVAYRAAREEPTLDLPAETALTLRSPPWATAWLFAGDAYVNAFKVIFALAGLLVLLLAVRLPVERYRGEYVGLLLFAAAGLMVMVAGLDLVPIFVGLELASVCLYALVAWRKDDPRSAEAGVKYLLLGSLASGIFIYGASLLYMAYGSMHIDVLAGALTRASLAPLTIIALVMVVAAFAFKVAAAPFHLWSPDVYQGAPTPVAAFLSTASKAAGFAVLVRVLAIGFPVAGEKWWLIAGALAAMSMAIGNLVAVHQNNMKRMLAYSGIAQAGYLLVAVAAIGLARAHGDDVTPGVTAVVLYLFLYMAGNIGAFGIAGIVEHETGTQEQSGLAGLRERAPLLAFGMTLLLLSLGGMPLLAGFVGKWFIFLSGVQQGQYLLVFLGAATSVVSIYYYLLVIKQIYILPAPKDARPIRAGYAAGGAILAIVLLTLAIGILPGPFLELARRSAEALVGG